MTLEQQQYNEAMYNYNIAWMQVRSAIDRAQPKIPIYQIHWNHHTWTFTDEREAWLFAAYWKLI